jgi:hypothetical protein
MRSMILMGCLVVLSIAAHTQSNGRVRSGTPLRWSMNGSVEVMEGDLTQYYGSNDSNTVYRRVSTYESATLGNPHATRVASVQALCEQNAVQLNWVAIQQFNADKYDVEQSADGRNWTTIATVLANRTEFGEANYNYNYTKNASNVFFRINAISTSGEHLYSSVIESPCSSNSYLSVTPNPVYSTTTIRLGSSVATKIKLTLVNSSGVIVQTSNATLSAGTNQVPLNMSGLQQGFYSLFIQWMGGKQDILKLVKQ